MELVIAGGFIAVVLVVVGLASYHSRASRIKREIRNAQLVTIEQFNENATARLQGKLMYLKEPLQAPLTGRSCAYFLATVDKYRSDGHGGSWDEIAREEGVSDFILDDGTGQAVIRLADAEVLVVKDAHFRSGTFNSATPELEAFLARSGESSKGWLFNRKLRYREGVLEQGEQVAVCGRGVHEPNPDPRMVAGGYR